MSINLTSSYSLSAGEFANGPINIDPTAGPITLTLPADETDTNGLTGSVLQLNIANTTNPVTLAAPAGNVLDSGTNLNPGTQTSTLTLASSGVLKCDGTQYWVEH